MRRMAVTWRFIAKRHAAVPLTQLRPRGDSASLPLHSSSPRGMSPPSRSSPVLSARALSAERGERRLFRSVDLELNVGEVVHVTGANGSGKTTFLRLLCGLREPHEGTVLWCGRPLAEQATSYRAQLAFLGHQDGVKLELSAVENIHALTALRGGLARISPERALILAGLKAVMNLPCRVLSAGQRRRVALGALLVAPKLVWILDEPFNTLDQEGTDQIADLIVQHQQRGGMVVLTSHQTLPDALADARKLTLSA